MLISGLFAYVTWGPFGRGLEDKRRGGRSRRLDAVRRAIRAHRRRYQVRPLVPNLRKHAAAATKESANELERLKEALQAFLAGKGESTADPDVERLKAKLDVKPAPTSSRAGSEVEILKAKRGKAAGLAEAERPETETLKAKLAGTVTETTAGPMARGALNAKSVERGVRPKGRPREAAGTASKRRRA